MAAEGLPAGAPTSGLPGWELDAWYQDLQEVLAAAEPGGPPHPWGAEQGAGGGPEGCELDAAFAAELLELLGPESTAGTEAAGPPHSASSSSSPAVRWGTGEEETKVAVGRGVKRKRGGGREQTDPPERAGEQRVLELTAHNERLRAEIQQLSAEVQRTRAALIDRIVNLRQA
ncbi:DDIT3 protein, partial [Hemiprocne comata]|nr:DDIT3 protein [Hemiprocne comata]